MSNGSQKTTGKFLFILDNILYIVFYTFPYKIHQLLESSSLMFFNIMFSKPSTKKTKPHKNLTNNYLNKPKKQQT